VVNARNRARATCVAGVNGVIGGGGKTGQDVGLVPVGEPAWTGEAAGASRVGGWRSVSV